jgi:tetratricopeptide (TPR) repeat protein
VLTYYNLGNLLLKTGQSQEAERQYLNALHFKPDFAEAYGNLAAAQLSQGHTQAAIDNLHQAIKLKPDYLQAYVNLATAYAQLNQSTEAISAAQRAVELARSQGNAPLVKQLEAWLSSYPFRPGAGRQQTPVQLPPPPAP